MQTKKDSKKEEIIKAALKVFAETGYHNAKVSKIAETAAVASGSIYTYFGNKEELILTIFESLWKSLSDDLDLISKNSSLSPSEKLDCMIDLTFDRFITDQNLAKVFVNELQQFTVKGEYPFHFFYEKFMETGEEIFRQGIIEKQFNENIDAGILRHFILGAIRNLLHLWTQSPEKVSLNKIRQNVKFLIKKGIEK